MEKYILEKRIWSEADFDEMGWHDSHIYKLRLSENLELDIDYILKWNQPDIEGLPFTFWVAPATLVFSNVSNLQFEMEAIFEDVFEIDDIELDKSNGKFQFAIVTQRGDIEFEADGFTQWIRQEPFFSFGQSISYIERGGLSLEQTTEQSNPNRIRQDIVDQQSKNMEHYENVKKRHLKRKEKLDLDLKRENGEINLKDYLTQKKEIMQMIDFYNYWLKGTAFESW